MNTAVIFGVTGQDGSYLAELLLEKGYRVVGVSRRVSVATDERIRHISHKLTLIEGDVTDPGSIHLVLRHAWASYRPGDKFEVYNLSAQSHVGTSFTQPKYTTDATYVGCLNILEAIRPYDAMAKVVRFYQASSSEMFGSAWTVRVEGDPYHCTTMSPNKLEATRAFQDEDTPMVPNSPYAIAKLAAHHLCRVYRDSYGLFCCSGILFNHESERRGENFVTRKIAKHIAAYKSQLGLLSLVPLPPFLLKLGNLDACRDWGHAEDYVFGMWLMLQQDKPGDYVLATGETHTVREFVQKAFKVIGIDVPDSLEGFVEVDPAFCRPNEVPFLKGDASKARQALGWYPEVNFDELVRRMVLSEVEK